MEHWKDMIGTGNRHFQIGDWVEARAAHQIDRLRELGVRVVGDLEELRPVAQAGIDPTTCPPEDALRAAMEALTYLVRVWPSP